MIQVMHYLNFATIMWYIIDKGNKWQYHERESIKFITNSVKPNLCDYSDAYILMTGDILVTDGGAGPVLFKICAPFSDGKTNINEDLVDLSDYIYMYILQCLCII